MRHSDSVYDSSRRLSPFVEEFYGLVKYWDLVVLFVSRSIKTRYKRSSIGVLWTLLNPLLTMVVLTVVFSQVFRFDLPHYPVYLLCGLTVWNYFSGTTNASMTEMMYSGGLLTRIYVPKSVFVVSAVGTGLVNLGFSLCPLLLITLITGAPLTWSMLVLPLSVLLITLFAMGLGLMLATAAVYFADMLPVYGVILTVWNYATPIFYPASIVPEKWLWLFHLNPMYYLLELFRQPIYAGTIPPASTWGIASVFAVIMFVVGWIIFTKNINDYAYRI